MMTRPRINGAASGALEAARAALAALSVKDREMLVKSAETSALETAASVVFKHYETIKGALAEAGLPAGDVIIITSDGESVDPEEYLDVECPQCGMHPNDDDADDADDDDDDDDDDDGGPVKAIDGPTSIRKLKAFMHKNKLTSIEVAEELGVSTQAVNAWLDKRNNPRAENRAMIYDLCGLAY